MQDLTIQLDQGMLNIRACAIIKCQDSYLFHRGAKDNYWTFVGGRVQFGEDSWSALKRELQEELTYQVTGSESLAFIVEQFFSYKKQLCHEFNYGYFIEVPTEEILQPIRQADGEILVFEWKTAEEIQGVTVYPEVAKEMIQRQDFQFQHVIHKRV
ncbi:hypothetical protein BAU15_00205 [Enterococcus sp. JM4C]|uniref:NUDIX hydrolase n=1 Tax=Candidatus Enterococcus huntleyi TaxID=1857217 RepID=UPI00137A0F0C|nr:NUDIX domain-containing protein [Enterococcus sp. JM4C]KAF1299103.1 hypothetical protein BAU15_00205 [Enterococcus sp. JM4C]